VLVHFRYFFTTSIGVFDRNFHGCQNYMTVASIKSNGGLINFLLSKKKIKTAWLRKFYPAGRVCRFSSNTAGPSTRYLRVGSRTKTNGVAMMSTLWHAAVLTPLCSPYSFLSLDPFSLNNGLRLLLFSCMLMQLQ
jgi:hypothetical protein